MSVPATAPAKNDEDSGDEDSDEEEDAKPGPRMIELDDDDEHKCGKRFDYRGGGELEVFQRR